MSSLAKNTKATLIPVLRYRDAPAAIEWLCQAFGFEKLLVVPNEDGTLAARWCAHFDWLVGRQAQTASDALRELRRPLKQPRSAIALIPAS